MTQKQLVAINLNRLEEYGESRRNKFTTGNGSKISWVY